MTQESDNKPKAILHPVDAARTGASNHVTVFQTLQQRNESASSAHTTWSRR